MTNKNIKQKLIYIKRYADILDEDISMNIYTMVRKSPYQSALRDSQCDQGIYLNVSELDEELIDNIYSMINRRVESIILK